MELTATFMILLDSFAPAFTAPSYATFRLLIAGWILSTRHRYVTDLIVTSDSVGNGHFSDYHRFFSQAKWSIDDLWKRLAQLLVERLVGPDTVIKLAGDDTLCRKRGLSLFGGGMHYDPLISSKAKRLVSWGHDWVNLCLIIEDPWWAPGKVFALPICMRLYRNRQGLTKGQTKARRQSRASSSTSTKRDQKQAKRERRKAQRTAQRAKRAAKSHKTRPELMREMLHLVAGWFPQRQILFVGDSLYSGESILRHLPANVDMIGGVHSGAALYDPPPPPPENRGPGATRKKGERLPSLQDWANDDSVWQETTFDQYGLHGTFETKTRTGLYYKAGKGRVLRFVLTRDAKGQRPTQIFYSTNTDLDAKAILSAYSRRWSIEVTHHDAKQLLGLEDPANRAPLAVQRTAPMAMFLYSMTVLWYHEHGHQHVRFPDRPWYHWKRDPSFADMLSTLRRITWEDKLSTVPPQSALRENSISRLVFLATLAG